MHKRIESLYMLSEGNWLLIAWKRTDKKTRDCLAFPVRRSLRICYLAAGNIQHFADRLHGLGQILHDLHILITSKLSVC